MTSHPPRRPVAALSGALLCLVLVAPGIALGHAELDTVTPADKSSVAAPSEIVMMFTETLDPSGSNIRLVDPSGAVVAQGGTIDQSSPKTMTLALASIAPGTYTIRWTSKSAQDGDIARGTTTFTATAATPPPTASPPPSIEPSGSAAEPSPSTSPSTPASPSAPGAAPSPSGGTGTTTSSTDALIPIVVVLVVLVGLGAWLLRNRSRRAA
jgi:methionine-rich copper-binding protein CopC